MSGQTLIRTSPMNQVGISGPTDCLHSGLGPTVADLANVNFARMHLSRVFQVQESGQRSVVKGTKERAGVHRSVILYRVLKIPTERAWIRDRTVVYQLHLDGNVVCNVTITSDLDYRGVIHWTRARSLVRRIANNDILQNFLTRVFVCDLVSTPRNLLRRGADAPRDRVGISTSGGEEAWVIHSWLSTLEREAISSEGGVISNRSGWMSIFDCGFETASGQTNDGHESFCAVRIRLVQLETLLLHTRSGVRRLIVVSEMLGRTSCLWKMLGVL